MPFSLVGIVVGAAVLVTWIAIVGYCCLCARRSWPQAAAWAEFRREHHDLDGELDAIWHCR